MAANLVESPNMTARLNGEIPMSLSILLPHLNNSDFHQLPRRRSQDSTGTTGPIARDLERISNDFIVALSNHDFALIMRIAEDHVAPDYQSWVDNYVAGRTLPEYLNNLRHLTRGSPQFRCRVLDVKAEVDEEADRATVWLLLEITGRPERLRRLTVCMMLWRRNRHGEWRTWQCRTMRGMPGSGVLGDI